MARPKKNEPVEAEVVSDKKETTRDYRRGNSSGRLVVGLVLIVLGGMFIVQNVTNIDLFRYFWPIVIIIIGLSLVLRSVND